MTAKWLAIVGGLEPPLYMHTSVSDGGSGGALSAVSPEKEWQRRVQSLFRTSVRAGARERGSHDVSNYHCSLVRAQASESFDDLGSPARRSRQHVQPWTAAYI